MEAVKSTKRQLRLWGAQTGGGLIVLGCLVLFWRGHGWGRLPLGLGILIALLGLTALPPARPAFRAWHLLVGVILWLWTRLALVLTFGIAVIPVALIGRLVGRDRMRLRFPADRKSEWRNYTGDSSPRRYGRQF